MTRKRFVRQLMAVRIDRNHANMLADDVWRRGIPYAVAHRMMSPVLAFMKRKPSPVDQYCMRWHDS